MTIRHYGRGDIRAVVGTTVTQSHNGCSDIGAVVTLGFSYGRGEIIAVVPLGSW